MQLPRSSRFLALAALSLSIGGCAIVQPASKLDARMQQLAGLYVGDFQTQKGLGPKDSQPVHVMVRAVEPPEGRRFALYEEVRETNASGRIIRQRLFLFDEAPGRQDNSLIAHDFDDTRAAEALRFNPGLVRSGALAYQPAPGDGGCPMLFTLDGPDRFIGRITPATCAQASPAGADKRMVAETLVSQAGLETFERPSGPSGNAPAGTSAGERDILPRLLPSGGKPDEMTSRWKPKY